MTKVDRFFLWIFLFLQVNFFDLIPLKDNSIGVINNYSQKNAMAFLVVVYIVVYLVEKNKYRGFPDVRNFMAFNLSIQGVIFVVAFASWIVYLQTLKTTIISSWYFLILLLYFPFSYELRTWADWREAIRMVGIFSFFLSASKLVQSFLIGKIGTVIFNLNTTGDYNTALSRNYLILGFTRIPSVADYTFFAIVLLIVAMMEGRQVFKPWVQNLILLTNVACLFLVGQSRIYIILLLILLLLLMAQKFHARFGGGMLFTSMMILSIPVIIGGYELISFLLLYNERRTAAALVRVSEIQYFLPLFSLHGWFGIGFPRVADHLDLLQGNGMGYYLDDIGITGFICRIGFFGLVLVLILIGDLLRAMFKSKDIWVSLGLLTYLLGSSISASLLDPQRIFYLPLVLTLLDFVCSEKNFQSERKPK